MRTRMHQPRCRTSMAEADRETRRAGPPVLIGQTGEVATATATASSFPTDLPGPESSMARTWAERCCSAPAGVPQLSGAVC